MESSHTRDLTGVPCVARQSLNHWITRPNGFIRITNSPFLFFAHPLSQGYKVLKFFRFSQTTDLFARVLATNQILRRKSSELWYISVHEGFSSLPGLSLLPLLQSYCTCWVETDGQFFSQILLWSLFSCLNFSCLCPVQLGLHWFSSAPC